MHVPSVVVPALVSALIVATPASAATTTLGSDLERKSATVTISHGADTAFWAQTIDGAAITVPEDGQIVSIKVKGTALREANAKNDPATMVHFQTLDPAGANGARKIYLTSSPFYMPVDQPNKVSTFAPENLCVRQGGAVAFNTIGGHKWGGSLDAPLVENQYLHGTPWQIFASASTSSTNWYSKDNGTKNGMTMTPHGGRDAVEGHGGVEQGRELLMQVVLATGDDRSTACGGPAVDENGNKVAPMLVNGEQSMFVTRDGAFSVLGYCGSRRGDCTDATATVTIAGKVVATAAFSAKQAESFRIPMKLSAEDYVALANAPGATQEAVVTLTNYLGTFTGTIKLRTTAGGALTLKAQKPYVSNDRTLKPYAICSLPSGCTGTATLTAKGKNLASTKFKTRKNGAILFAMRLKASTFRALKKAGTLVATLTVISNAGTRSTQVILRK